MRYHQLLLALIGCFVLLSGTASAQPRNPEEQFNRAVELAKANDHGQAVEICLDVLERLSEGERPRVHKLLGYSYKKLDQLPEAWHHLTTYLAASGKEDPTAGAWLEEVEAALKETHVKVSFSCVPSSTTLKLPVSRPSSPGAGVAPMKFHEPTPCPVAWWLPAGKHRVAAGATGHEPRMVEVDVRARGDSGVRELRLEPNVPILTGDGEIGTTVVKPAAPKKPTRALEWALIGSGLALGVTGGILQGVGYARNESLHSKDLDSADFPYEKKYQEQVRPMEISSYVLYGVGGAAVVAGVVTWFVRKPGNADAKSSVFTFSPLPLRGGTGALMTLEF